MVVQDARQRRAGGTERGLLLEVERREPGGRGASPSRMERTTLAEYLEASPMMQADDPAIRDAASRAVAGAGSGNWEGAQAIARWVYGEIANKGFGSAFASAREVLRTGSGDCSEHAVLAATMARSVGIPSRVVAGLVHYGGAFAYHMWIEVWAEGGWYALDPALGQESVDATHIKLAESAMRAGSVGELALGIMKVMNRLGVRVVEYEMGDAMHRVGDDRSPP
jgi:transglutaminase-like putative cysteine protease